MNTSRRLAAFGVGLAAAAAVGAGVGATIGPAAAGRQPEAPAPVGEGVVSAKEGYRLIPGTTTLDPDGGAFRFVITSPDGDPQLAFTPVHQRDLHLIVVNRELTSYSHAHPDLGADGTWSIDLPALPAGSYRAVADFQVADGPRLALGIDVGVAGTYAPGRLDRPSARASVDGYDVSVATERGGDGGITASFTVGKDGRPVTVQPYLGAGGHLVAMRQGDLAYAHVHPVESGRGRGGVDAVSFGVTLTSAGRYALFFDFKHAGTVRTAAFTFDQGAVPAGHEMMED